MASNAHSSLPVMPGKCSGQAFEGYGGVLTHDGGVVAVGDAGNGVDARQHGLHMVLVQLDGVGVRVEVVTGECGRGPVGVGAPAGTCTTLSRHMTHPKMLMEMMLTAVLV